MWKEDTAPQLPPWGKPPRRDRGKSPREAWRKRGGEQQRKPLYNQVMARFFATAKLVARAIVIHQEHATGAWKGEEEENTGAGRWSNAYAKEHERLTTKVQQRLPFAESRCAHAAIQHK